MTPPQAPRTPLSPSSVCVAYLACTWVKSLWEHAVYYRFTHSLSCFDIGAESGGGGEIQRLAWDSDRRLASGLMLAVAACKKQQCSE